MKYEVIKGVVIRGTQYKTGDTVDIDDLQLANDMMNLSRVIPYTRWGFNGSGCSYTNRRRVVR